MDDEISLSAQESSNQIVLSGSSNSVKIFSDVIEKLDRAPRQVYLDAIIAEVSEESASKLGLQFSVNSENLTNEYPRSTLVRISLAPLTSKDLFPVTKKIFLGESFFSKLSRLESAESAK